MRGDPYYPLPHNDIISMSRFLLSLASCHSCVVIDDHLNVLPISSHTLSLSPLPKSEVWPWCMLLSDDYLMQEKTLTASQRELSSLQQSMADSQPVGPLLSSCLTLDQVHTPHTHLCVCLSLPPSLSLMLPQPLLPNCRRRLCLCSSRHCLSRPSGQLLP